MKREEIQLVAEELARQARERGLGAIVILGDVEAVGMVCSLNIEGSAIHVGQRTMGVVVAEELEERVRAGEAIARVVKTELVARSVNYLLGMETVSIQAAKTMRRVGGVLRHRLKAKG